MRDVFDVKYNDELQENYKDILWCDLNENLKENLIEEIMNGLKIENHRIPSRKALIKRANGFYNGRRMMAITKDDPLKRKRRKLAVKANRLTYVSYSNYIVHELKYASMHSMNEKECARRQCRKVRLT